MAKKITQEKLAELANLNIRTILKIEADHVNILVTNVLRLRKALGCSRESLMERRRFFDGEGLVCDCNQLSGGGIRT